MPQYSVKLYTEFTITASGTDAIRTKLEKMVHTSGFDSKNFEWEIDKVREEKQIQDVLPTVEIIDPMPSVKPMAKRGRPPTGKNKSIKRRAK